jgi:hypothetical protein
VVYTPDKPDHSAAQIDVMFVIRNEYDHVLVDLVSTTSTTWDKLWNHRTRYASLDIPAIPGIPGSYKLEVYFNNCLIVEKNLTILENN